MHVELKHAHAVKMDSSVSQFVETAGVRVVRTSRIYLMKEVVTSSSNTTLFMFQTIRIKQM